MYYQISQIFHQIGRIDGLVDEHYTISELLTCDTTSTMCLYSENYIGIIILLRHIDLNSCKMAELSVLSLNLHSLSLGVIYLWCLRTMVGSGTCSLSSSILLLASDLVDCYTSTLSQFSAPLNKHASLNSKLLRTQPANCNLVYARSKQTQTCQMAS